MDFIKRLIQRNNGNPAGIPAIEESLNRFKDEMETKKHRNYEIMAEVIGRESAKPVQQLKPPHFPVQTISMRRKFLALALSIERTHYGFKW